MNTITESKNRNFARTDTRRGTTIVRDLYHQSDTYLNVKPSFPKTAQTLKIIPIGGVEEIGRNMTLFEYGNDIILVDAGIQFPEEDQPGIDYIIPNVSYLKGKEDRIRAMLVTHGHMDHIGAIPHIMPMIGNPPIYTTALTMAMIQRRHAEHLMAPKLNAHVVKKNDRFQLGVFDIEFIHINHTIPDATGIIIRTPAGNIFHTGDFKFDHSPIDDIPADIGKLARLGNEGVMVMLADSTGAMTPGHAMSEMTIQHNIDSIFKQAKGKVIAATFSTLLNRMIQIIKISEEYGRKVVIEGYSMRMNLEIVKELGYFKIDRNTIIKPQDAAKLPPEKLTILCTGAQGESNAALMRIATKEHRQFRIEKGDTVIFSSSIVPGNESSVQRLKDLISRQKARVIHYKMMDIHVGGHAPKEDLRFLLQVIRPKYLIPVHGNFFMLKAHGDIAKSVGMARDNILLTDNGRVVQFNKGQGRVTPEKVPSFNVMVDGLGVGDLTEVVIRDRQVMAQDGILTIIAMFDPSTGKVTTDPEVISKGFVYMKSSYQLIQTIQKKVKEIIEQKTMKGVALQDEYVRNSIRDELGMFLYQKTQRRPMILPFIVEV